MKKVFLFAAAIALTLASCGNKSQGNAAETDSTATEALAENSENDEATANLSEESKATVENMTAELQKAIDAKDSKAAISTLANLQTIYKNLVAQGKLDEAKAYGSAIKNLINKNADALKNVASGNTTIASLVDGIKNLPTSAEATAEQAKAAIGEDITSLASPAIAKGATAVATAKEAAEMVKNAPAAVKNAAENAANQAVNDAKTAAENKVNSEINKANQKANDAVNKEKAKADKAVNDAKAKAANKVNEANQKANKAVNDAANKALKGLGL